MFNHLQKTKTTINATLVIPLGELAIYILKRGEENSLLLELLHNKPKSVNVKMAGIVREILRDKRLNVKLQELKFSYNDSDNFNHGASYFDARLRGTENELTEIIGEDKMFYFDGEGKEK